MSGRRGFLALIGGAGAVTGSVLFRKATAAPTLILPGTERTALPPLADGTDTPLLNAVLACGESQMHAFIDVKRGLSDAMFLDWLEGGLRLVQDCKADGGSFRAVVAETGRVPKPPRRWVGPGGRTAHEQAYLEQTLGDLRASIDRSADWSAGLPIRQGGRS